MRKPANPAVDLDVDAIQQGADRAACLCGRVLQPADLIVVTVPGRLIAFAFDGADRMLMIDTIDIVTEEVN